ncbi:hypothetical protein L585_19285 [Pantoea ananatis BRT175]|nr:hypothetical protein L585_19285 [Pantoea ananatis BRT175]
MRQHHPQGEAHRAEAILHDPPNSEKSAFRRFFRFCAPVSIVQDENLPQVRLNRKAVQADAPASPEGRGPPGRGNPARPTKFIRPDARL